MDTENRGVVLSEDYVTKFAGMPKLTKQQKDSKLNEIWKKDASPNKTAAFTRIGQGMVGPIQIKLNYEGFCRSVLVEDALEKGPLQPYDVLDDLGQAYVLNQTDGEVKIQMFEGKQVYPNLFRIAAFPMVRKEDLFYLRANLIEHAQNETRQAIMKQEDGRLLTLLASAISSYATEPTHTITPDHIVEIGVGNPLDSVDFYDLVSRLELHEIKVDRVLMNPADARDLYTWNLGTAGPAYVDSVFSGKEIDGFGEFKIQKSILVPQGTVYMVPEPNWLGMLPVKYSLDVVENPKPQTFHRGWVMDELIGMLVLNPRGLGAIKKA